MEKDKNIFVNMAKRLVDEEEIVESAYKVESLYDNAGVYFLIYKGRVVYVGQSLNAETRIRYHHKRQKILFDGYAIDRCHAHELNFLETLYIEMCSPVFNKQNGVLYGGKNKEHVDELIKAKKQEWDEFDAKQG